MGELSFRDAVIEDYEVLNQLQRQVHQVHVEGRSDIYKPADHLYTREDYEKMLSDDRTLLFLAEMDGVAIGTCTVIMKETSQEFPFLVWHKIAYIDNFCVLIEYRGQGVGRRLLKEAKRRGKERGADRMDLTVWAFNQRALSFYEAMGMKPQRIIMEENI